MRTVSFGCPSSAPS